MGQVYVYKLETRRSWKAALDSIYALVIAFPEGGGTPR